MAISILKLFGTPARRRAVVIVAAATVFWGCTRAGRASIREAEGAEASGAARAIAQ